jgi:hypothetical protein
MTNYLLLYRGGGMPTSDDDRAKVMAAWGEWMKQCGENLVDAGNPCSNSKSVSKDSVGQVSGDPVTGYSVIKANSMDDAVHAAQMVPLVVDGSGSCDVYETFEAM